MFDINKALSCLMSLVDKASDYRQSDFAKADASTAMYAYKEWLAYSHFTGGYAPNKERAESCKKLAIEKNKGGIILYFPIAEKLELATLEIKPPTADEIEKMSPEERHQAYLDSLDGCE